jgi:peroxiredoxin
MANQLTGDFDAVVQLAARQVNGLLATLHVNGASDTEPLQLLHSARLRIGDVRRPPFPDVVIHDWVVTMQKTQRPRHGAELLAELVDTAPPGVVQRLTDVLGPLGDLPVFEQVPIRGTADVQISTITVSVPSGSTSEIAIRAKIRAHYRPDPNTTPLPAPIHGDIRATFNVHKVPTSSGRQLVVRPSADDNKIQFLPAPGSGMDAVETSVISAELRKALRRAVRTLPVDLPADFPFEAFKGVGTGPAHAIALGLQLTGAPAPPNAISSINQSIVGPSGFAFGVRKEVVNTMIDLEAIKQEIKGVRIRVRFSGLFGSFTLVYKLEFSSGPTLTFRDGAIDVSGRVSAKTDTPVAAQIASGFVEFKQAVRLVVDNNTQVVGIEAVGEPDVDESWFIPHGRAVREVKTQIANALARARVPVRKVFDDARQQLRRGLRTFERTAVPFYVNATITPDGIIVRGDIQTAPRPVPVVDVRETRDGTGFTAFRSWIPGGRLEQLTWSWVEYNGPVPSVWSGETKTLVQEHEFIIPKPPGITTRSNICLRIDGALTAAGGAQIPVQGGTTCIVPAVGPVLNMPAWFEPVTVPIWRPDIADSMRVRDAISGHVSVASVPTSAAAAGHNTLVYFADWKSESPLRELGASLAGLRQHPPALAIIVVAPVGAFDARRKELEAKMVPIGAPFAQALFVTEDDEGAWTRTFGAARVPAIFLLNARRQFVWKHDGIPSGDHLASALTRFTDAAPPLEQRPLRLSVGVGERAPDAFFDDGAGGTAAIHRMRGRRVVINFWQGWSQPSLNELRRLRSMHARYEREGTMILAFHGGTNAHRERVRNELGITFPLLQDSQHTVASAYGVRCWPTTITVDADAQIEGVQFGAVHHHGATPERDELDLDQDARERIDAEQVSREQNNRERDE